jgi:hypothetical protein
MGAAADCELIGPGFFGQPMNSLSTLALVAAGALVLSRQPRLRMIGVALIATGVGSFLFHGPMPRGNEWAHDVTLAWLLVSVGGVGTRWERLAGIPALVALGVVFAVAPAAADPIAVVLAVVTTVSLLRRDRSARTVGPLTLLGVVAVLGRLGATGGPLCDAGSLLQTHALWHVGAAVAVSWWALAYRPQPEGSAPSDRVADGRR